MSNSSDHEQNNASENSQSQENHQNGDVKMMTQSEYLRYKQENSNANNYYGFSREVDVKPVAWVRIIIIIMIKVRKFLNFSILGRRMESLQRQVQKTFLLSPIVMHQTFAIFTDSIKHQLSLPLLGELKSFT